MAISLQRANRMLRTYSMTMAFLSCLTISCAGEAPDGGGGGGGDSIAVADYLTRIGMQECDDAFACKATFPTDQGETFDQAFGASVDACYTGAAQYYDAAAVEAAISGGTITYDGAAASACLAGIAAPNCATYWTEGPDGPAECDTALVGKVADGAACKIDFECSNLASVCAPTTMKCTADTGQRPSTSGGLFRRVTPVLARAR